MADKISRILQMREFKDSVRKKQKKNKYELSKTKYSLTIA
jgi:uncharacterized protein YaiI (UPF0178 family)